MRGVEKLEAAELDERNVAPGQLEFERGAVVGGAEQHRLGFQRGARLAVGEHAGRDEARLIGLVRDCHERGRRAGRAVGPEVLGVAFGRERDHRIGGGQDGLGRAVVAVERHDAGRRIEAFGKIENVAHGGGAERIDRLRVVADHGEAPALAASSASTISACSALVS